MRKVIVVGGSFGALEGLCTVLQGLSAGLNAAILAVVHTGKQSQLPLVLARCTQMPVRVPQKGEPIMAGNVFIPAPNKHLIVRPKMVESWMGPRENRHRPAVDTLFRSAARAYRDQVIAIVLSGTLDDGTLGAMSVKKRGGIVIVQNPTEAAAPSMPQNVIRAIEPDFCLPLKEIAPLLIKLSKKSTRANGRKIPAKDQKKASGEAVFQLEPPGYICPYCGRVLTAITKGQQIELRCRLGHTYSKESFTEAHADALELALWVALRKFNEQRNIQNLLAEDRQNSVDLRKRHRESAMAAQNNMQLLHEILDGL